MEKHESVVHLGKLMAEALRAECSARRHVTVEETNPNLVAHQSEASTSTSNPTGTHTDYSPKSISFLPNFDTSSCNLSSQAQPQSLLSLIDDIISSPTPPIPNLIPPASEIQNPIYSKPSPYPYPSPKQPVSDMQHPDIIFYPNEPNPNPGTNSKPQPANKPKQKPKMDYSLIEGSLPPRHTNPNVESPIRDEHGLSLGNLGPASGAQSEPFSGPPHTNEIENHLETLDESSPVLRVIENPVVNDGGENMAVLEAHKHQRIMGSKRFAPPKEKKTSKKVRFSLEDDPCLVDLVSAAAAKQSRRNQ
jgi:hypothetical protein